MEEAKTHKLFLYGTLLTKSVFEEYVSRTAPEHEIISIEPGYIEAKLYREGNYFPIAVETKYGKEKRFPLIMYGGIVTIKATDDIFVGLDGFEGCSKASYGRNHPNDIYHRKLVDATPIRYNSVKEFINFNFSKGEPVKAWVYFGNMEEPMMKKRIGSQDRRIQFWHTFYGIEHWEEYLNN